MSPKSGSYMQIVEHFETRIHAGDLPNGVQLPTQRQLSEQFSVSGSTVTAAMRELRARGLIETRERSASVVVGADRAGATGETRARMMANSGRIYPPGEYAVIRSSELVDAPDHIADALGLEWGSRVLRRERVHYAQERPVHRSVSWMPAEVAELVPELLTTQRIPGGTVGRLAEVAGEDWRARRGRDVLYVRTATDAEQADLNMTAGTCILAGRNTWRAHNGRVVEYGEYVNAPGREVTFTYPM